jgi:hypothetical protein
METKLKELDLGRMFFILILHFSTGYTLNLQAMRKNIVEITRDR